MPDHTALPLRRSLLLFVLLFAICCGLGYPVLNRASGTLIAGLSDAQTYAAMVEGAQLHTSNQHMRFRVLVPYLAKVPYSIARGRIGTWDAAMFGLLVIDSLFTAGTALLLLAIVNRHFGSYPVALGAALLYLLNFAVPNLRLAGLVDAGEGFFLLLLVWALLENQYWTLPLWGILGALTKESFVPFMVVLTLTWWMCSRPFIAARAAWIVLGWATALAALTALHWRIATVFQSPLQFGLELHHNSAYLSQLWDSVADRQLWYIFVWLLPLSLLKLKTFPRAWLMAMTATGLTAVIMNTYYGGAPGTLGRALFSIAGPLLSASVALFLFSTPATKRLQPDAIKISGELPTGAAGRG